MHIHYSLEESSINIGSINLKCQFIEDIENTETISSLVRIFDVITPKDILLTLPSSKDQIVYNGIQYNGYTEFLRNYFSKKITMNFLSSNDNVLLLTDHIPIENVPKALSISHIVDSIACSLDNFPKKIESILISGLNPHAGEGGLISKDDEKLSIAITQLKVKFPTINFKGPIPSDTIHFQKTKGASELVVYCYHDQGLNPFKLKNGLIGINLSLGLDFKRLSVDHGTAFNLFGKNKANYQGMLFLLNELKNWTKKSPV
jgi:4-hydroxythreonine-4-phosphate dehydrogenase